MGEVPELDANAALQRLWEAFGQSARFTTSDDIPREKLGDYVRFRIFLEAVLRAAKDPLLDESMWVDSMLALEVRGRKNQWRVQGWLICGEVGNEGGGQWDVGFEVVFGRRGVAPRCRFREPAERRLEQDAELGRDLFVIRS